MNLDEILSGCQVAFSARDYHALDTEATAALSVDKHDAEALRFHAISAFALGRIDDAESSCLQLRALKCCTPSIRAFAMSMLRGISIIRRVEARYPATSVSNTLHSGWYVTHLNQLISAGELR